MSPVTDRPVILTAQPFKLEPQCIADVFSELLTLIGPAPTERAPFTRLAGVEEFVSADGRVRVLKQFRIVHDDYIYRLDVVR